METHHIYTSKRKVLLEISNKMKEMGDFKYLDILVIKSKHPTNNIFGNDGYADKPNSYEELVELLKDVDKVYSFNKVETKLHEAIGYDIIIEG